MACYDIVILTFDHVTRKFTESLFFQKLFYMGFWMLHNYKCQDSVC